MLAPFEPSIAPEIRDDIQRILKEIEEEHDVRILFAIESGSRAWGFPSPDSDYDVRFVYAHRARWYLSLMPGRDVIELPISNDLDIGGWDLRKALNLLLKANPVLLEWLSSPIRYHWDEGSTAPLLALAERTAAATACMHHYRSLGEGQWRQHIDGRSEVTLKKYFYVLRPALALRWIRMNATGAPPMNIQAMSTGLSLDPGTIDEITHLLALKAATREAGEGARLPNLDRLILAELDWASSAQPPKERPDGLHDDADALFRSIVMGADR
ncbi:MAG: nucleotidyltransferase domain-containing protein [Pseudomonadota bacterium]